MHKHSPMWILTNAQHPQEVLSPSIHLLCGILQRAGLEAGSTLDKSPVHHRAQRQTTTHSHIQIYVESLNYPQTRLWMMGGSRVPGENPCQRGQNMQTSQRSTQVLNIHKKQTENQG